MKYFNRLLLFLIVAGVVCFGLFAIGAIRLRGKNYVLGNNITQTIGRSLKIGDNRKKVVRFLDENKLSDRQIVNGPREINEYSLVQEFGKKVKGADSVIIVLIPDVEHSLSSRFSVTVVFFFDKQRKLIDFKSQKMGIGL